MFRQSSSRNQRSKGVKVKYAVQICLLLAVSFWLIYQVKHSHDKKKELDDTESKASPHTNAKNSILGRKDIHARDEETTSVIGDTLHKSMEEEGNVDEGDEENKPEEDETKPEEDEHEEKNIDHEQENLDGSENEEKSMLDESDHSGNGNDDKSMHEARDENYKADDASSAVTHEATGLDSNSTDSAETDFSISSDNNTVSLSSDSSMEMEAEKSGLNDGTDEDSRSTVTENPEEEIPHEDSIDEFDASDLLEEKHVRTDLDTLPEIQTEGANNDDDVSAE